MIVEWFTHLTTPCDPSFKCLGYLKELVAIHVRARRSQGAWRTHLETCRNLISESAAACPRKGRAVVLGSGLLLDIPLETLAATFDNVRLIDVCHLRETRRLVTPFKNVELVEADIGGSVAGLLDWTAAGVAGLPPPPQPDPRLVAGADFVISANLLSQIHLVPGDYFGKFTREDLNDYRRSLIDHHLAYLQGIQARVCLITEFLMLIDDGDDTRKVDPLHGLPLVYAGEEWWWDFQPRRNLPRQPGIRLRVLGVPDLAGAERQRMCRNTTLAAP